MNKHRAKERERHSIDTRDWDWKGCESSRTNKNIRTGMIFYRCTAVWKELRADFYGTHWEKGGVKHQQQIPRQRTCLERFIGAWLICWKVTTSPNNRPELKRLKGMRRNMENRKRSGGMTFVCRSRPFASFRPKVNGRTRQRVGHYGLHISISNKLRQDIWRQPKDSNFVRT